MIGISIITYMRLGSDNSAMWGAITAIIATWCAACYKVLYNTLFSREENFAKSEFEIFSREDIFVNILFTRKYLPAKISSRENIFPRKYLLAKISSRENIFPRKYSPAKLVCLFRHRSFLFAVCCPVARSRTQVAGLTLDLEFASDRRNNGIIPTISNLDRSYI